MMEYQGTQEAWDAFVAANAEDGGVLQSWEWGQFQESLGRKIWRLVWGEQKIEAACLLIEHRLPLGLKYIYAPRGPVITKERMNIWTEEHTLDNLIRFVKEQDAIFLRIEPPYGNFQFPRPTSHGRSPGGRAISNFQHRPVASVQPTQTLRVDLTKSIDDMLAAMHEKTRYNIRLAEKRGVIVENPKLEIPSLDSSRVGRGGRNPKQIQNSKFEIFFTLMKETAKRDGFSLHSEEHYKRLANLSYCLLFTAYYQTAPLATALVAFFGTTAYYLHGASSSVHRDVMAPYALHWAVIQEAKRRGCTSYDLWGIDEKRWPGVTRFKRGFVPQTLATLYIGTFDIPIWKRIYWLYRMLCR